MTDRPRGDALDQELRSATRAIVSPTPPPPDFDELAIGLSDRHGGEVRRARVLVFAAVVIAVIGGVVALVIAATGSDDAGIVVTDDGQDALDRDGVSVRDLMWVEVPLDDPTFGSSAELIAVAASESMVVVGGSVGDDAALWTSADRTTWTRVPHDEEVFGGAGEAKVTAITPWRSGFVAAGEIRGGDPAGNDVPARELDPLTSVAAVWISEDGITWERIPHDEEVFGGHGRQQVFSIAALDDRLVIVGFDEEDAPDTNNDIAVWTSSDGRKWRQEPSFGGGEMFDVVATGNGFVGVGAAGLRGAAVWTSPDGAVWERVSEPGGGYMADVETVPEGFIAVGSNRANTSTIMWAATETSNWTRAAELAAPAPVRSVAAVAAGDSGLVAISGDGGFDGVGGSQIFVSTDGTIWESAASLGLLSESAVASLAAENRVGHAVAGFGPNFLAVGRDPAGRSAMWTTQGRTDPGSPENEADTASVATSSPEEAASAGDVYLAPGETLLRTNPVVVQGSPGPEPRFDTTPLGPEIELEPLSDSDIDSLVSFDEQRGLAPEAGSTLVRIVTGGIVADSRPAFVVYYDGTDPTMGPMRWLCELHGGLANDSFGSSCGGFSPGEYLELPGGIPQYDIPRPNYSIDSRGYLHFYPVSEETSVISLVTGDQSLWQRPVGGFAVFPADLDEREPFEITTFDPDGNILVHETLNEPPLHPSEYPTTRPEVDSTAQYPQTSPSDSNGTP